MLRDPHPPSLRFLTGKRNPTADIQLPQHYGLLLGTPHSSLNSQELWADVQDLTILANRFPTCSTQAVVPISSLLIGQTKCVAQSDWETQHGAGLPDLGLLISSLPIPGSWPTPTQAGELNQSPALC